MKNMDSPSKELLEKYEQLKEEGFEVESIEE